MNSLKFSTNQHEVFWENVVFLEIFLFMFTYDSDVSKEEDLITLLQLS